MDWSADGRFLLYDSLDPKRGFDIWALPLEGDRKPFEVVQTDFNERLAQFSPDGTWIAYQSDKTGRFEIYVRPFPGPGGDSRVSIDGGAQVRWNPNGKELFYIAADDRLMAVPIRFASNGKAFESGTPRRVVRHERGQHGHQHEQTAIRRFSGRPVVRDELRCGRSQRLAHHGHPELEAEPIAFLANRMPSALDSSAVSTNERSGPTGDSPTPPMISVSRSFNEPIQIRQLAFHFFTADSASRNRQSTVVQAQAVRRLLTRAYGRVYAANGLGSGDGVCGSDGDGRRAAHRRKWSRRRR